MKSIIEINNLSFGYNDNLIFKKLKLKIAKGSFTTILGPNGSGKTTLVKLILGLIKSEGAIMCEGLYVTSGNLKVLRRNIGVVLQNIEDNFVAETVMDEIAFSLENLNFASEEIRKRINSIAYKLKIKKLLEKNPYSINILEKWLVSLASALVINPKVLIIDNGFNALSPSKKELVLKVLRKYNEEGMTIINFTSDAEECLYGNEVIVLDKGNVLLSASKEEVFKDLLFEEFDLEMPFMISLSNKLKFYDLIHDTYFSEEKLVDVLWK